MEWKDAVFRDNSLLTAFGFAAYLASQNDPRAEPLQFLFSQGKTGKQDRGQEEYSKEHEGYLSVMTEARVYYPNCTIDCEWLATFKRNQLGLFSRSILKSWLGLAEAYVEATELTRQRWRFMTVHYGTSTIPTQQELDDANLEFSGLPIKFGISEYELRETCRDELLNRPRRTLSNSLRTSKDVILLCRLWSIFAVTVAPATMAHHVEHILPFDLHF